jgi:hypothetical protein
VDLLSLVKGDQEFATTGIVVDVDKNTGCEHDRLICMAEFHTSQA